LAGVSSVAVLDMKSRTTKTLVPQAVCGRYGASGHLFNVN
jgi:hypothetical protein